MYRSILVPVDLSHGEVVHRIVNVAKLLAAGRGRITLLNVTEPVPAYVAAQIPKDILDQNRTSAEARLAELAAKEGVESHVVTRQGSPATEILEEAEAIGADAIILGSHRPDYTDYLLGSTAARVVRHARCTVIIERSTVTV
jgi:universal stress protein F